MQTLRRTVLAAALALGFGLAAPGAQAKDPREIVIGTSAGPYADQVKASEKDITQNLRGVKLLPLEAAQLPRALQDADCAFVNGNYALAPGLKLADALRTEKISRNYVNLVAVRTLDLDKPFASA
jgi:D-methionine transport system substrate-binding protein